MKITAIETLRLGAHPNLTWVEVHTDAGVIGLGETWFGAEAVEADIHARIAGLLIGQDPRRIEHLHHMMQPYSGFTGTGAEMRALSAVDVALWDIAGKRAGMPICDLMGGRLREEIQVYNTCAGPSYVSQTADVRPQNFGISASERPDYEDLNAFLNHPEDLAASLLEMGISSMKIWPLDFAQGAADGMDISPADLRKWIKPFEAIRAAHGDKMRIKAELHGLWSLNAAKKICAALEPIGMDWIEDPIWMDHTRELAELAAFTTAPLAGGETLAGLGAFKSLISEARIGTPIMDVVWGGGITTARKVAALAEAEGRPISFHDCSGPVTLAVSTHLALALKNVREQEMTRGFYHTWYGDLVDELPKLTSGMITVSDAPGLGLGLEEGLKSRSDALSRITREGA